MTDKQIIIDDLDTRCPYHCSDKIGQCVNRSEDTPNIYCIDNKDCIYKLYARKEQECEELNKELHKNFEEKDKLHLIIDRLLEASGYDTNTASAEDFEDVYENMHYEKRQLDQLKAANEKLKQTLAEIKPILEFYANSKIGEEQPDRTYKILLSGGYIMAYDPKPAREALRKINEVEGEKI